MKKDLGDSSRATRDASASLPEPQVGLGHSVTPTIARLRDLAEKATKGPWEYEPPERIDDNEWTAGVCDPEGTAIVWVSKLPHEGFAQPEDAEFAVAAVNALPALIDRIEGMARALRNCSAALLHALAVMPADDPLYRKVAATEKAARAAIAKATAP